MTDYRPTHFQPQNYGDIRIFLRMVGNTTSDVDLALYPTEFRLLVGGLCDPYSHVTTGVRCDEFRRGGGGGCGDMQH